MTREEFGKLQQNDLITLGHGGQRHRIQRVNQDQSIVIVLQIPIEDAESVELMEPLSAV